MRTVVMSAVAAEGISTVSTLVRPAGSLRWDGNGWAATASAGRRTSRTIPTLTRVAARTLVTLGLLFGGVCATAAPAAAHTVSGAGASNFQTTVTGLRPAVAGLILRAVDNGSRLELAVDGRHEVIVDGYEGEPYLRIGPHEVFQNARSPATYLNQTRTGAGIVLPADVDPKAPPRWQRIGGGRIARWHDHRVHWAPRQNPPVVQAAPGRFHQVTAWTVPLRVDGQAVSAVGTLDWVPAPSPVPWYGLAVLLGLGTAAVGLWRRWAGLLAAATAGVVAADLLHSALIAASRADRQLSWFLSANAVEIVAWALGLVTAYLLARRSLTGLYLAGAVGFVIAMVGGLADLGVLSHSSAPIAGPIGLARLLIAVSVGVGFGLMLAVAVVVRRPEHRPPPPAPPHLAGQHPPATRPVGDVL